jgi:outer membrane protein assembly factor BamB
MPIGLLLAGLLAAAQDAAPPDLRTRKDGSDWGPFLGPTGDGKSPEKGLLAPWPAGGPRIVWQRALGTGYAAVAVERGRCFVFERVGGKARASALKSETGEELWRFEVPTEYEDMYGYNNGPRCAPVADGDRVYVFGADGVLLCLKAADGALVWKKDTTAEYGVKQNFFGVGSAPLVEGDLLLVQVGGSPPGSPGVHTGQTEPNGTALVAYDKRTGEVRWKLGDDLASYASPVTATIGGRRWGFLFARSGLLAFDPATGKADFSFPWRARMLESVNASNPVVVGDEVLISECYQVGGALLRVRAGAPPEPIWADGRRRDPSLATHWMTPIHVDGFVYGSSGRHTQNAELRCVEWKTGKVRWSVPNLTRASLLHVDGHFVVLGEDGVLRLVRVDPEKYVEVSKALYSGPEGRPLLEYPAWAAPVLAQGLLYVRGKDRLLCLEAVPAK